MKQIDSGFSKNLIWNAFGNLVYLGSQWLLTVLVTRKLGFEQAGVFSLALSVSAIFQALALFGTRNFQVSDLKAEFSDRSYITARLLTCAAALLLCTAFCAVNGYPSAVFVAVCGMMLFRTAECFSDVLHGILQKNERLYLAGISFTIRGTICFIGFLTGVLLWNTIGLAVWIMALVSVAVTLGFDLRKTSRFWIMPSSKEPFAQITQLFIKTFPLCLYQFFSSALVSVPKYMLERILDETALGIYSAVFTPVMLIQAVSGYLFLPFAGKLTASWKNSDKRTFLKTIGWILLVICAFSAVVLVAAYLGKDLLVLLFGEKIAGHTGLLVPAVICSLLVSVFNLFGMIETILRDQIFLLISSASGLIISCVLLPVMIRSHGIGGANTGQILGLTAALLFMTLRLYYKMKKV